MAYDRDWVDLDCLQFVNGLFVSLDHDERVDYSLRRIFTEIIGKLLTYADCTHGLHLLSNCTLDANTGEAAMVGIDYLYVDEHARAYLDSALQQRRLALPTAAWPCEPPTYVRFCKEEPFQAEGLRKLLRAVSDMSPCWAVAQDATKWMKLFSLLSPDPTYGPSLRCPSVLVIPLTPGDEKLWLGYLGAVVLWRNDRALDISEPRLGCLMLAAKILTGFVARFLKNHHGVSERTYLPSYRVPTAERWVTVMFADIRGFTPATEILRNFNLSNQLKALMLKYHERMGQIIQEDGGRVHGLAGDGIMALFGEYAPDAYTRVTPALRAARRMCKAFEELKAEFFLGPEIRHFFEKEYEPLDVGLGIGINYGPVIFDYFGARGSRVYSPLGDHVNFAQRLEAEAHRFDSRLGRQRAAILLSRPAWNAVGADPLVPVVTLQFKGKPYEYQAYEYGPE